MQWNLLCRQIFHAQTLKNSALIRPNDQHDLKGNINLGS